MSVETASIEQHCKWLHLSSIGTQFASLAEEARQQNHSHLRYLDALLGAEVEERERRSIELRLKDAHLPRIKTLGGVRLRSVAAYPGLAHPRSGRRKLSGACRTGAADR